MKLSITLTILGAAFLRCAFGQGAPANIVAGMGYLYPPTIVAPGQLITVFLLGNLQGDISASVSSLPAPVLEVRPASSCSSSALCSFLTAITVQIPYEFEPSCYFTNPACEVELLADLIVTVNGVAGAPIDLTPAADHVHILTGCDTAVPGGSGSKLSNGFPCAPLVTHADGSMVMQGSPAQGGEEVVAYAVGLGLTTPAVKTGQAATAATPTNETFYLDFNFRPNSLATKPILPAGFGPTLPIPLYTGLVPGYAGLYQINFIRAPGSRGHPGLLRQCAIQPDGERGRASLV
ncbi:MAG: hypothetical protein ABSB35_40015 [Bryobacteraceae bacterium]|jgi:uncharacterized protein (TIGR03437 family)